MITMTLKGRKGPEEFKVDEHPRPQATKEQLSKLPPVFKKGGTVTAGNASVSGLTYVSYFTTIACFTFLLSFVSSQNAR